MDRSILIAGMALSCAGICAADVIVVPGDHATIQGGINAAGPGDEVRVGPGTWNESINLAGKPITLVSMAGPDATVIDASGLGNVSVVRCVSGEGPSTVIDGFTMTAGRGTLEAGRKKGGGMFIKQSSPTVRNCTFLDNTISAWDFNITGSGAGMYVEAGNPTVLDCTFVGNELLGCSGWLNGGAGMYNDGSSPVVDGCHFIGNEGNNGGGMMNVNGSHPVLTGCRFEGNVATYSGGGMNSTAESNATVVNSVFRDNTAWHGAGLYTTDSDVQMVNCTVAANSATSTAGGLYLMYGHESSSIANCIFWGNTAAESPATKEIDRYGGALATVNNSDVQGGWAGPGWSNIDVDPQFAGAAGGDLHLQPDSPALDTGSNLSLPSGVDTDLDGNDRIAGSSVDMGAYELPVEDDNGCPSDLTGDGWVDVLDLIEVMGLWGPCAGACPPGCPGDLNGDCTVDVSDLVGMMESWGDCPD